MAKIAELAVQFTARTKAFTQGVNSAQRRLTAFSGGVASLARRMTSLSAGLLGLAGVGGGLWALARTAQRLDELAKTSDKLGVAAASLTRLGIGFDVEEIDLPDRESAKDWIDSNQLGRRNLTKDQFTFILGRKYNRMKKAVGRPEKRPQNGDINSGRTVEQLAKAVGVSKNTVERAGKFTQEVEKDPELFEALQKAKPLQQVKKERQKQQREKALQEATANIDATAKQNLKAVCDIRCCDFADLFQSIERPDAIITDPPYPREYVPLYENLAICAKDAGVPIVAVMCGQSYFPEIAHAMSKHLTYRWLLAYLTPGGQSVQLWQPKVNTFWKPILLFGEVVVFGTNDIMDLGRKEWDEPIPA